MGNDRSHLRAFLMLGIVMLCWAGNSIIGRAVRDDIPPLTLAFGRWTIAVLILLPIAWRQLLLEHEAVRAGWRWIVALGVLGIVCFNSLVYSGLHYTTAANALLLQASVPAVVLLLDRIIFKSRPEKMQAIGVIVSTLGVAAIVFRGELSAVLNLEIGGKGDALILCAVTAWSLYTVLLRKKPPVSAPVFLLLTFTLGSVVLAPLAAMEWLQGQRVNWGLPVLGAFAYVGVFPSIIAYFIYNAATATIGPARAGQGITLMPLFGALLSALLLGERLHGYHFAGIVLILAGIILSALALRSGATGKTPVAPGPARR